MAENQQFSDKYPKLSMMLGIFIVLFSCAIIFCAGRWFLTLCMVKTISFVEWITSLASNFDVVVIVALITGMVSIVTVVLSSIVAKWLDYKHARREYLTQKREGPYSDFVEMIYRIQQTSKDENAYPRDEMIEDLMSFSKQITLWGSSKVVKDWVKFKENAMNNEDGFNNLMLTDQLMNDMRKDLGLKRMKKGNLLAFFVNDIKDAMKQRGL